MKLSRINEYWPLLEAVKAGKKLQIKHAEEWVDLIIDKVHFSSPPESYRVKPELVQVYCVWWESKDYLSGWYLNDYKTRERAEEGLKMMQLNGHKEAFLHVITKPE